MGEEFYSSIKLTTGEEIFSLVSIDEKEFLFSIEKLLNKKIPKVIIEGFEPDPSIKANPINLGGRNQRFPQKNRNPRNKRWDSIILNQSSCALTVLRARPSLSYFK